MQETLNQPINLSINRDLIIPIEQSNLFDYSNEIEVRYGGSASGKSEYVLQKLLVKALKISGRIINVYRQTAAAKVNITTRFQFQKLLDRWNLNDLIQSYNKVDMRYTFINGSTVSFASLEDRDKLKGLAGVGDVFFDEADQFKLGDFVELQNRLRDPNVSNKQIYLCFNPVSKVNWVYKTFFTDEGLEQFRDTKLLVKKSTYKDNPFADKKHIDFIERQMSVDPSWYAVYAKGEFVSLEKLVYPHVTKIRADEVPNNLYYVFGLDFGYVNDPSAFVKVGIDKENKRIYVVEDIQIEQGTPDMIADIIARAGYKKEKIVADSAEQEQVAMLKNYGLEHVRPVHKYRGNYKSSILNGVNQLHEYQIFVVTENANHSSVEFDNYAWKKDKQTDEYINEPVDEFNHFMDAIRYSIMEYTKNNMRAKSSFMQQGY